MPSEASRRHSARTNAASATARLSQNRKTVAFSSGTGRWWHRLILEVSGAIDDHRQWIDSDRSRRLAKTFDVSGRLLTYAAYLVLAYLSFTCVARIQSGIAAGFFTLPEQNDGSRVALFNILASALLGPILLIAAGVGIGWVYNLAAAAARRLLPRFVQPWVHPAILFVVVIAFAALQPAVTTVMARGYLLAKVNIDAGLLHTVGTVKVIEISSPEVPEVPGSSAEDEAGERQLVRLRSMFAERPCLPDEKEQQANPSLQESRPEPGLEPGRDCRLPKSAAGISDNADITLPPAIDR